MTGARKRGAISGPFQVDHHRRQRPPCIPFPPRGWPEGGMCGGDGTVNHPLPNIPSFSSLKVVRILASILSALTVTIVTQRAPLDGPSFLTPTCCNKHWTVDSRRLALPCCTCGQTFRRHTHRAHLHPPRLDTARVTVRGLFYQGGTRPSVRLLPPAAVRAAAVGELVVCSV